MAGSRDDDIAVRVRERRLDGETEADAAVRSPWADERYERVLCGLDVAVVPAGDDIELWLPAETDPEAATRLTRLVEFDIAMDRQFGAARDGEHSPSLDEWLNELTNRLGADAIRVAVAGLVASVSPSQPTSG